MPDLAEWTRARVPEMPDAKAFELAPDWVCEVLQRSTARIDRAGKVPAYARTGVAHVWLVDPALQTLDALRVESVGYWLLGTWYAEARVEVEPFDAIELELAARHNRKARQAKDLR